MIDLDGIRKRSETYDQSWYQADQDRRALLAHVDALAAKADREREAQLRRFVGWLSGDIPELHRVEVPILADSLDRFLAADAALERTPAAPNPLVDRLRQNAADVRAIRQKGQIVYPTDGLIECLELAAAALERTK